MIREKWPRTPHLPWSEGIADDDKRLLTAEHFCNQRVVVSEKRDGECSTFSRDYYHARSLEDASKPWQTWLRNLWSEKRWLIPEGYRVHGECLYAKHSIGYPNLETYFEVFSISKLEDGGFVLLDWASTEYFAEQWGFKTVPILYLGECYAPFSMFHTMLLDRLGSLESHEGYVIRKEGSFPITAFPLNVAKYVRKGHVQTDKHWTKTWSRNV